MGDGPSFSVFSSGASQALCSPDVWKPADVKTQASMAVPSRPIFLVCECYLVGEGGGEPPTPCVEGPHRRSLSLQDGAEPSMVARAYGRPVPDASRLWRGGVVAQVSPLT